MAKLGVNIDHVATLRQQRGTPYPCPVEASLVSEKAGAYNITAHLREDRRHIQDRDIHGISDAISIPLNFEMANHPEMVKLALKILPGEACLVPERREELTTEGGLNATGQLEQLKGPVGELLAAGIAVSLFIEPEKGQIDTAATLNIPVIELHTGTYCELTGEKRANELVRLKTAAEYAHSLGIQVNAGHGITLDNVQGILEIPYIDTLNIGHSIISRAVFTGLEAAVKEMIAVLK